MQAWSTSRLKKWLGSLTGVGMSIMRPDYPAVSGAMRRW
jgi:hypothetical protein